METDTIIHYWAAEKLAVDNHSIKTAKIETINQNNKFVGNEIFVLRVMFTNGDYKNKTFVAMNPIRELISFYENFPLIEYKMI